MANQDVQQNLGKEFLKITHLEHPGDMEFAYRVSIDGLDDEGAGDTPEEAFKELVERIQSHYKLSKMIKQALDHTVGRM